MNEKEDILAGLAEAVAEVGRWDSSDVADSSGRPCIYLTDEHGHRWSVTVKRAPKGVPYDAS